jgi:hypothetical protein
MSEGKPSLLHSRLMNLVACTSRMTREHRQQVERVYQLSSQLAYRVLSRKIEDVILSFACELQQREEGI